MRINSKGQVTIPADLRRRAGLLPHTEVEFEYDGGGVRVVRASITKEPDRGNQVVARLRGSGDIKMTTDEIMALLREP